MAEISEIDGCPILDVNDASLVGTWCDYSPLSIGTLVTDEFHFAADKTFVWRKIRIAQDDAVSLMRSEGTWRLEAKLLKLEIAKQDFPDTPSHRVHFSVRMRDSDGRRQLVMKSTLFDDDRDGKYSLSVFPYEATPGEADRNHAEYEAKRKQKISVDGPFKELASILTKAVPAAVRKLELTDPIFCVRLFYHDTHAPAEGYGCWVRCLTERARQRVLNTTPPKDIPDQLWHPTMGLANEIPSPDSGVYQADLSPNAELTEVYTQIYSLLAEDEEKNIAKLRAALRRVSLTLHMITWPVAITDDFVAFPADGSNFFGGEYNQDMKASIPAARLKLLAARGYI